jgi:hypothetical protein
LVEEDATGTDENAEAGGIMFKRLAAFTFHTTSLRVGVVTNLYHMARALKNFKEYASDFPTTPVFAEDWVPLVPTTRGGEDWIESVVAYYENPVGGVQYPVETMREIMTERRAGNFTRSVGELMGIQA